MNYLRTSAGCDVTEYEVGQIIGRNFKSVYSAFIGSVISFGTAREHGLYLVCEQGVFLATNPSIVYRVTSTMAIVERWVDIEISIKE